jgi:hypothetical protein
VLLDQRSTHTSKNLDSGRENIAVVVGRFESDYGPNKCNGPAGDGEPVEVREQKKYANWGLLQIKR